jgi:hypothetical protein
MSSSYRRFKTALMLRGKNSKASNSNAVTSRSLASKNTVKLGESGGKKTAVRLPNSRRLLIY